MIVHQDDRGGRQLKRTLDHLARIDRRVVDGAGLLDLIGDHLIAFVEEDDAELLLVGERHGGPAIIEHRGPRRQRRSLLDLPAREPASRFLLTETVKVPARLNVIRKNLALASGALGVKLPTAADTFEFPVHVSPLHAREAEEVVQTVGERFTILNPGGGWPTKLWDASRYGELADTLLVREGLRSVVTYGPGERELAERVVASSRAGAATWPAAPR